MAADVDPWNSRTLLEHSLADRSDVDDAFDAAREAQREWAATVPVVRAEVLHRASAIVAERADEIVG
jgi:acyl-CoA reductase-like NAD-dependent aldehyde dehydrogenase